MTASGVTLLGTTGFVGQKILRDLSQQGIPVEAVSRQARPEGLSTNIGWTQADLNDPDSVARIPWKETVISTVLVSMTAQVVELWPPGAVKRLVAFSSTSALTKVDSSESFDREVSAQLQDGEARLRQFYPNATILRPTMIYGGPGDRNVERVARQLQRIPIFPLVGRGTGLRQPVHADDLAIAAVSATNSLNAHGKTYNLAGAETLTFKQMIQRIGQVNDVTPRFISLPLPIARSILMLLTLTPRFRGIPLGSIERMSHDLVFDTSQAHEDFQYSPRAFLPPRY
jgi:uncharacterized protein YbjT (DUF2867 family)